MLLVLFVAYPYAGKKVGITGVAFAGLCSPFGACPWKGSWQATRWSVVMLSFGDSFSHGNVRNLHPIGMLTDPLHQQ